MSLDTPITPTAPPRPTGLSRLAQDLLPALYQHRLIATSQLHRLFTPHARRPVYLRQQLKELRRIGLVDATARRTSRMGNPELLWYITARGAEAVAYDPTIRGAATASARRPRPPSCRSTPSQWSTRASRSPAGRAASGMSARRWTGSPRSRTVSATVNRAVLTTRS